MTNDQPLRPSTALQSLPPSRAFPPFGALRAFDALVRLGSISAAADALSVNRAMINRHLRALETWTGATLIRRTRNAIVLTDEGRHYYELLTPHIEGIATATLSLLGARHDNRLNIWCMPGFAALWLMPRLSRFRDANPNVAIELRAEEAPPNFSRHDADLAIRYSGEYGHRYVPAEGKLAEIPTNVRILELARLPVYPVASPDYLARAKPIAAPVDLLDHVLINEEADSWLPWFAKYDIHDTKRISGPMLWQTDLALNAARHGLGIALANHFHSYDDLVAGRLVRVGGFEPVLYGSYLLIARPDRWVARPVARFRHWITELIKAEMRDL